MPRWFHQEGKSGNMHRLVFFGVCEWMYGLLQQVPELLCCLPNLSHPLPAIWQEMVDSGLESGRACGKALRTVKSCIGSTWCRYRQQDSVSMAVSLVGRYKGVKMAVSSCLRESAEAQERC